MSRSSHTRVSSVWDSPQAQKDLQELLRLIRESLARVSDILEKGTLEDRVAFCDFAMVFFTYLQRSYELTTDTFRSCATFKVPESATDIDQVNAALEHAKKILYSILGSLVLNERR